MEAVAVEDDVAVVGRWAFPIFRICAELDDFSGNVASGHGNDFDRDAEVAKDIDMLAVVYQADEFATGSSNDLLPCQRASATLDQGKTRFDFVGAVDVDVKRSGHVQVEHLDAVRCKPL